MEGAFSRLENDRAISYSVGEGKGIVFYPDKRELPINVDNNGNTRDAGQIQTQKINSTLRNASLAPPPTNRIFLEN